MSRIARPPARAACVAASGVLVAGTGVLAFRSGFEDVRAFGGVAAWLVAAILVLVLPRERLILARAGYVALVGVVLLTVWTAIAKSWAPLPDLAGDDLERMLLYSGAFVAAILAFGEPVARRLVEPGLLLVAVAIIGYGVAGRVFPDLDFAATPSAAGRLAQPLTYWNAMGAVAAVGLVLAIGIVGNHGARARLQIAAGAVTPLLGLGLFLSVSRGAVLAALAGAATFLCLRPRRPQVVAACIGLAGALSGVLAAGGDSQREGTSLMVLTLLFCALAAAATWRAVHTGAHPRTDATPRLGRRAAAAIVVLALLIPVIGAPFKLSAGDAPATAQAERFRSVGSARYAYWRVALEAVPDHPLKGVGPAGYRVLWTRERSINESVGEAHSLQLETAVELGLPGLGFLLLFIGGTLASAASALRRAGSAAGTAAALVAWTVTASIDWMWELPAVALFGVLLGAAIVAEAAPSRGSEATG